MLATNRPLSTNASFNTLLSTASAMLARLGATMFGFVTHTQTRKRRTTTMHDFIIAAAIAAFAIFCVVMALAPIIMEKGKNGYEDLDND